MQKKILLGVSSLFLLLLGTVACGKTEVPATVAPIAVVQPTLPPVATTSQNSIVKTTSSQNSGLPTTAVANQTDADLTAKRAERDVVKTFTDVNGKNIKLLYGRGSGHGGDYGWAHIMGKHLNGIWYDGGTITTFPQAVGAKTPQAVIDLIGKSLQDLKPDAQPGGRFGYNYAVPGTNKDIFTVVGSDGTIITSYPVPHGSKNEDD